MTQENPSIFRAALRAFVVAAFTIVGIFAGFLPIILLSAMAGDHVPQAKTRYEVIPDATGRLEALKQDSSLIVKLDVMGMIGREEFNGQVVRRMLHEVSNVLFDAGRVKAVLLELKTPGGTVYDSDEIYRLLSAFKQEHQIPVFAYVNGLCASGGMYVAAAADRIYASDVSVLGSVGVLLPTFVNFYDFLSEHGIKTQTLTEGKGKDVMNPMRPWREGEEAQLQALTTYYYDMFVDILARNRPNLDRDKLVDEYGAGLFPAPLAEQYGFIDGHGYSQQMVLQELVEAADIDPSNYQVVHLGARHWWDNFVQGSWTNLLKGTVKHEIEWIPGLDNRFANQPMYLYRPGL